MLKKRKLVLERKNIWWLKDWNEGIKTRPHFFSKDIGISTYSHKEHKPWLLRVKNVVKNFSIFFEISLKKRAKEKIST